MRIQNVERKAQTLFGHDLFEQITARLKDVPKLAEEHRIVEGGRHFSERFNDSGRILLVQIERSRQVGIAYLEHRHHTVESAMTSGVVASL